MCSFMYTCDNNTWECLWWAVKMMSDTLFFSKSSIFYSVRHFPPRDPDIRNLLICVYYICQNGPAISCNPM